MFDVVLKQEDWRCLRFRDKFIFFDICLILIFYGWFIRSPTFSESLRYQMLLFSKHLPSCRYSFKVSVQVHLSGYL